MTTINPSEREFTSIREAVASTVAEPIWYVDTAEAIIAPYDPPAGAPPAPPDPRFFGDS